ncbi:hypothetical protein COV24_03055 [candidate division WWE3 bacterium CG10_big_fil_rev_8_21_14_0_10_32_10]|uniref:Uncharacterized protein n=1 Tax=candidate division WWE3 bacterium CG10_big_fil_rev_8_21_14_0_10_32_10 TaxID=1975090 RepID=A0A2H0RA54_UNCKA|nr:MAG: hypothetical protein COV24_03055 [candidate division WWE3 bacterium CG10_big_fil_rev_8_21_14_0_10_32_10]
MHCDVNKQQEIALNTQNLNVHVVCNFFWGDRIEFIRIPDNSYSIGSKALAPNGESYFVFEIKDGLAYLALNAVTEEDCFRYAESYSRGGMVDMVKCPHCKMEVPQGGVCDQCEKNLPYLLTYDKDLLD